MSAGLWIEALCWGGPCRWVHCTAVVGTVLLLVQLVLLVLHACMLTAGAAAGAVCVRGWRIAVVGTCIACCMLPPDAGLAEAGGARLLSGRRTSRGCASSASDRAACMCRAMVLQAGVHGARAGQLGSRACMAVERRERAWQPQLRGPSACCSPQDGCRRRAASCTTLLAHRAVVYCLCCGPASR